MIDLENAFPDDAPVFATMEQEADTKGFIIPYGVEEHARRLCDPSLIYLRILDDTVLVGFIILALDTDRRSVEFRRIVLSVKNRGFGQLAIGRMEQYCQTNLGRSRVWLDVFEHNERGRHIYEKLGYRKFGEGSYEAKPLWLYEKML